MGIVALGDANATVENALNRSVFIDGAAYRGPDGLFVRGLHNGGTSLISKLLALHPDVSPISSGKYFIDFKSF